MMTRPSSDWVEKWWPLPTSLDLVFGEIREVGDAVFAEVQRYCGSEKVEGEWIEADGIEDVFKLPQLLTNVPTFLAVMPAQSGWVALWNNSYLCDGYDSLCHNLTRLHGFRTLHWRASENDGRFQAGASFTHRILRDGSLVERSVYCGKNGDQWEFYQSGEPLVEEDTSLYAARKRRDRLSEASLLELLLRMGARPRSADFYQAGKVFVIRRLKYPSTITARSFGEICCQK
jgi:hypothetical protein